MGEFLDNKDDPSLPAEIGLALEDTISRRFEKFMKDRGLNIELCDPSILPQFADTSGLIRMPDAYHISCTPDRLISGTYTPVQLKSVDDSKRSLYGAEGTSAVEDNYLFQVTQEMAVLRGVAALHGVPQPTEGYLSVLFGKRSVVNYWIPWDAERWAFMKAGIDRFYNDYMVPQIPPPVDGSEAYKDFLNDKYGLTGKSLLQLDPDVAHLPEMYFVLGQLEGAVEAQKKDVWNRIALLIGENYGVEGEFGKLLNVEVKGGLKVEWEPVARTIKQRLGMSDEDFDIMVGVNSSEKKGYRKPFPSFKKDWKEATLARIGGATPTLEQFAQSLGTISPTEGTANE